MPNFPPRQKKREGIIVEGKYSFRSVTAVLPYVRLPSSQLAIAVVVPNVLRQRVQITRSDVTTADSESHVEDVACGPDYSLRRRLHGTADHVDVLAGR